MTYQSELFPEILDEPTGMESPLLKQMLCDICDGIGFNASELSPLYTQLALAALQETEALVLTYVVSQLKNSLSTKKRQSKKATPAKDVRYG